MHNSIKMLIKVIDTMQEISDEVVFVGGAVSALYGTDLNSPEISITKDVDCVVEITSYAKFAVLEERLRKKGFKNDISEDAPKCRFIYEDLKLDVMPTGVEVLDFKSSWYSDGIKHAITSPLPDGKVIRIFTAPYFIATKIEAFRDRGNNELKTSRDFEDIVFVLNHGTSLIKEISESDGNVKGYIIEQFASLVKEFDILEAITYNLSIYSKDTVDKIANLITEITALK